MEIIETSSFTSWVLATLKDLEYAQFQEMLRCDPEAGDLILGGGGLRKVRLAIRAKAKGKRGGARVIYYWKESNEIILLLYAYEKSVAEDLNKDQLAILRELVEEEFEK